MPRSLGLLAGKYSTHSQVNALGISTFSFSGSCSQNSMYVVVAPLTAIDFSDDLTANEVTEVKSIYSGLLCVTLECWVFF